MIKKFVVLVWLVLFAGLNLLQANPGHNRKPASIDDIMKIRNILEAQISPDGSLILYVISEPDLKENFHNAKIWLVSSFGGKPIKLTNGPRHDNTPRWSPDGRRIAFISDRNGKSQVWLINPAGGEAEKLTDVENGVQDFSWSPDGRQIAFLAQEGETEKETNKDGGDIILVDQNWKMNHIHLINVETKESKQLTRENFSVSPRGGLAWSPDGQSIAFTAVPTPTYIDMYIRTDVCIVNVNTGEINKRVERPGTDRLPKWSPDGSQIAFISTKGKIDWTGNNYLCIIPANGTQPQVLSKSFDESINQYWWSPDGKTIYFPTTQGVTVQLYEISVETGVYKPVTSGVKVHGGFSFSHDFSNMAFLAQDPDTPWEVYVSPVKDFKPVLLTNTNPQLKALDFGKNEIIHWKSPAGMEIEGLLVKPVGYKPGKRYPLVTYLHGGPMAVITYSFAPQFAGPYPIQAEPYSVKLYAGQGFAVFMPNFRGTSGYGERFRKAAVKEIGYGDYDEIMSGIDYLINAGIADSNKLGIMGASYGGYMTFWMVTQTNRFKAACAGAGISNWVSFYGQTDIPEYCETYLGGVPWKNRKEYHRHSPIYYIENVETPTLIQHGEEDFRVPLDQAKEFYLALKKRNIPVEFAVYKGQSHVIMKPRSQKEYMVRNLDWFHRWLK